MAVLQRPDGVELYWESAGHGSLVVLAPHSVATRAVYSALVDELARDHRVVTYDPRGCGASTRRPPVDPAEDDEDLAALIGAAGGRAVIVGWGDGAFRGIRLAVGDPRLVAAVVVAGANALAGATIAGTGALGASQAVREGVHRMAQTDYRASVRMLLELTNPDMSAEEMRERIDSTVAYVPVETAMRRSRWFYEGDELPSARALGDRLWLIHWPSTWSPPDVADHVSTQLPEAHVESLPDGAISRPDLAAAVVRRAVSAAEPSA